MGEGEKKRESEGSSRRAELLHRTTLHHTTRSAPTHGPHQQSTPHCPHCLFSPSHLPTTTEPPFTHPCTGWSWGVPRVPWVSTGHQRAEDPKAKGCPGVLLRPIVQKKIDPPLPQATPHPTHTSFKPPPLCIAAAPSNNTAQQAQRLACVLLLAQIRPTTPYRIEE